METASRPLWFTYLTTARGVRLTSRAWRSSRIQDGVPLYLTATARTPASPFVQSLGPRCFGKTCIQTARFTTKSSMLLCQFVRERKLDWIFGSGTAGGKSLQEKHSIRYILSLSKVNKETLVSKQAIKTYFELRVDELNCYIGLI